MEGNLSLILKGILPKTLKGLWATLRQYLTVVYVRYRGHIASLS